jgi:predicted  nucleic acid-binding Zn-ribbon protein
VEEQTRSMREALRRLEEDVGRIEGIGKAQAQFFQRSMQDWERQRKRLEREHGELLDRIEYLADEV